MSIYAAARTTDPITSHLADAHHTASGAKAYQQRTTTAAVESYPGMTSLELGHKTGQCRFMLARRLPECEEAGTVRRGPARKCAISGRQAVTWFPSGTPMQMGLVA